jgi:hypothetical protein
MSGIIKMKYLLPWDLKRSSLKGIIWSRRSIEVYSYDRINFYFKGNSYFCSYFNKRFNSIKEAKEKIDAELKKDGYLLLTSEKQVKYVDLLK